MERKLKFPAAYQPLTTTEQAAAEGGCKPSKALYALGRQLGGKGQEAYQKWYTENVAAVSTEAVAGFLTRTVYYDANGNRIQPPAAANSLGKKLGDFFYGTADLFFALGL